MNKLGILKIVLLLRDFCLILANRERTASAENLLAITLEGVHRKCTYVKKKSLNMLYFSFFRKVYIRLGIETGFQVFSVWI